MYELLTAHALKIPDPFLCPSILEMGINPCVGQELFFAICIFLPNVLCKSAIVSMICLYTDSMALGIAFEH